MAPIEYLGLVAAICTSTSFIPQAIKTIKTQRTQDISLLMYSVFTFGIAAWLIYGLAIVNVPIIVSNAITLLVAGTILVLKIKNG